MCRWRELVHLEDMCFRCKEFAVHWALQQFPQEVVSVFQEVSSRMGGHVRPCPIPGVQTQAQLADWPEKTNDVISVSIRVSTCCHQQSHRMLNAIVSCIQNKANNRSYFAGFFTFPINWRGFLVFFLVEKIWSYSSVHSISLLLGFLIRLCAEMDTQSFLSSDSWTQAGRVVFSPSSIC